MTLYQRIKASLRLRSASIMASKASSRLGRRFYVIPSIGARRQLVVVDRKNFRILKAKGYISPHASVSRLASECFYCSAPASPALTASRRRAFFAWWQAELRAEKDAKAKP